jgi:hypothetical protein
MSLNGKYNTIFPIHIKSYVLHAKSHVSLPSYYGSTCQSMTPVIPRGLANSSNSGTLLTVLHSPNPTKKNARAQWSEFSAVKSDDDDDDDFLYHQLPIYHCNPAMKVMTPFLIFPTTIMTSMTTCHQISFAKKMNKLIPHLKGKALLHMKGKVEDSASERDIGFDEETDSTSESADGSGIVTSGSVGSVDTNPGPAIPPNDETAFSSTPQFPKDQANLVKLELVNLVLEIGAPLHLFQKIAKWAARANSCGHIFKPNDCPHYKTYLKDLTKRLELESLSHTMD